ncbi:MAG: Zn-dependent hydrolase [Alicyclobacillus sp.]|nr:Zn-dependent hydrolase [Alicyclobacillus sp.]
MRLPVNQNRIRANLEQLESFHEAETRYTRRSFTGVYQTARQWLTGEMRACGLDVYVDHAGNLIGRLEGTDPHLPVLMTGSHIDTVENGGRYDGTVGVVGGLEVVRALADAGIRCRHTIEVVDFLAEEPSFFGISTVGSRGMAGKLTPEMMKMKDPTGRTLAEAIRHMGGNPERLVAPLRKPGEMKVFLEVHIEQGPVLEKAGLDVGLVTGIAGIHRYRIEVDGEQGHAGTVPMDMRRDALVAAARMVEAIRMIARSRAECGWCVATVGEFDVQPNHANVIPGRVVFKLEVRALRPHHLSDTVCALQHAVREIAEEEHCLATLTPLSQSNPVLADDRILGELEQVAQSLGLRYTRLPSGAGHDAAHVAALAPMAMIFIPCRGGLSHHPDEYATDEQITRGVSVLGEALLRLDQTQEG